jgi:hypothetical protein
MKATIKKEKDFDTVKTFRAIKEEISKEIEGMTFEQLRKYLDENNLKASIS